MVSNQIFRSLDAVLENLWRGLDRLIRNLEELRRYLLAKLNRFLEFLENLKLRLVALWRVLYPYVLIFVPPSIGIVLSLVLWSAPLAIMTVLLFLLLAYSFRATSSIQNIESASNFSIDIGPSTRVFGAVLAGLLLLMTALISIGLFLGFVLFLLEFLVIYLLRRDLPVATETQA